MQEQIKQIIKYLGEDPDREGLLKTPSRVEKAYKDIFSGYNKNPKDILTVFENESKIDQIVGLSNIEYYSNCEHHMLPFFGFAHIYYIPNKKIVGISKLARVLDIYAKRLQNQERLAKQVADCLEELLEPKGVAVILTAEHMCMKMRGCEKAHGNMRTSDLRGAFRDQSDTRAELFNLLK